MTLKGLECNHHVLFTFIRYLNDCQYCPKQSRYFVARGSGLGRNYCIEDSMLVLLMMFISAFLFLYMMFLISGCFFCQLRGCEPEAAAAQEYQRNLIFMT